MCFYNDITSMTLRNAIYMKEKKSVVERYIVELRYLGNELNSIRFNLNLQMHRKKIDAHPIPTSLLCKYSSRIMPPIAPKTVVHQNGPTLGEDGRSTSRYCELVIYPSIVV